MRVGVLGATGRIGGHLLRRLMQRGVTVVALHRDPRRAAYLPPGCEQRQIDLAKQLSLKAALRDVDAAASCVPPKLIPAFVAALPDGIGRAVMLASARRYTRFPDARADAVRVAEDAFARSGHKGVILHPTMIYGAQGENNVQRIAGLIRRFGVMPLPGGGRSLMQPIYVLDVVACLEAALFHPAAVGPPLVVAGPEAVTWADFVRAIAAASGQRVRILAVPVTLLRGAAWLTRLIPGIDSVRDPEVRRLLEDKAFSIGPMQQRLAIVPTPLSAGLADVFAERGTHSLVPAPAQPRAEPR